MMLCGSADDWLWTMTTTTTATATVDSNFDTKNTRFSEILKWTALAVLVKRKLEKFHANTSHSILHAYTRLCGIHCFKTEPKAQRKNHIIQYSILQMIYHKMPYVNHLIAAWAVPCARYTKKKKKIIMHAFLLSLENRFVFAISQTMLMLCNAFYNIWLLYGFLSILCLFVFLFSVFGTIFDYEWKETVIHIHMCRLQ